MAPRHLALEFRANQLEYATGCRVTGGVVTPRGVRFRLAPGSVPELAGLRQIFGRSVRLRRSRGELAVETEAGLAHRVPLGQLVAGRRLPRLTAVLGVDGRGRPVWLDLNRSRHLLVEAEGEAGRSLLLAAALSLAMGGRQRDLQLIPIGERLRRSWRDWPHRLDLAPGQLRWPAARPESGRPALVAVVDNLAGLAPEEQTHIQALLASEGVHLLAIGPEWPDGPWPVARPAGDEAELFRLGTVELQAASVTAAELKTITDRLRAGRRSRVWSLAETMPARRRLWER